MDQLICSITENSFARTEGAFPCVLPLPFASGFVTIGPTSLVMKEGPMGLLRILGKDGDREIPWDPADPQQLEDVRCGFETLLRQGYQAYSLDANGRTG